MDDITLLNNLAASLRPADNLEQVQKNIVILQEGIDHASDSYDEKPNWLNMLASTLESRFSYLGDPEDIERAISVHEKAITLTPDGHSARFVILNGLGNAYLTCFNHSGNLHDIDRAIDCLQEAARLCSNDDYLKAGILTNVERAFRTRFEHSIDLDDLEKAITTIQEALDLMPDDSPLKPGALHSFGNALAARFENLQNFNDLRESISIHQKAIELTPDGDGMKPKLLANLGNGFHNRFVYLGERDDLEKAIALKQEAYDLTPDDDETKLACLHNLANALFARFDNFGEIDDIDRAIAASRRVVDLTPDGHISKASRWSNLGNAFWYRFVRLNEPEDLERAVAANQESVDITSDDNPKKPLWWNSLGNSLEVRYYRLGKLDDLEKAIAVKTLAVDHTPDTHPNKPDYLNNLGIAFKSRFELLKNIEDLQISIDYKQKAIDLTADGHPDKAAFLSNLGISLVLYFDALGNLNDILRAIEANQQAVDLTPDGHAEKPVRWKNLGNAFRAHFQQSQDTKYRDLAISSYQKGCAGMLGDPAMQVEAALSWARLAPSLDLAITAFSRFMVLIPRVVWLGQKVHYRYEQLPYIGKTIGIGVAAAIKGGNFEKAVEWLEEGRNVVWGQILHLRTPLDRLQEQYPEKAEKFRSISQALDIGGGSLKPKSLSLEPDARVSEVQEETQIHHKLARHYEELIQEIQSLEGFEGFLKPKRFSELAPASANGPVVILNSGESQCDALLLLNSGEIKHIPLPNIDMELLRSLQSKTLSLGDRGVSRNGERLGIGRSNTKYVSSFSVVLAELWLRIVQPIVHQVNDLYPTKDKDFLPHITWCATGAFAFLPLHAAGIYDHLDPGQNTDISDFVVSSYTTKLSTLIGSTSKKPTTNPQVLAVSLPNTDQYESLPGTTTEVEKIKLHVPREQLCHLNGDDATVDAVLEQMHLNNWVHLACHGVQGENPLESAFILHDGRLKLERLMGESLENAELAVLSACQTATGDEKLPEEAVHLAAGMLAVGYPSVIATMWAIRDTDGPIISEHLYAQLYKNQDIVLEGSKRLSSAYALHAAVKHLRLQIGDKDFERWVPFVHFGI